MITTTIESPDKTIIVSRLKSFLVWKKYLGVYPDDHFLPTDENDVCAVCGGHSPIDTKQFGIIRCLCEIQSETKQLAYDTHSLSSRYQSKKLAELQPWGDTKAIDTIIKTVDYFLSWILWPTKWVLIQGPVGCGKSHILQSIATEYRSWATYITAADLESKIYNGIANNSLSKMITILQRVPILLLDDIGADYGKDFPVSQMRKIIDFRYQFPEEYITVVATNLERYQLREYDVRLSDRLLDVHIGDTISMKDVGSWRSQRGK